MFLEHSILEESETMIYFSIALLNSIVFLVFFEFLQRLVHHSANFDEKSKLKVYASLLNMWKLNAMYHIIFFIQDMKVSGLQFCKSWHFLNPFII